MPYESPEGAPMVVPTSPAVMNAFIADQLVHTDTLLRYAAGLAAGQIALDPNTTQVVIALLNRAVATIAATGRELAKVAVDQRLEGMTGTIAGMSGIDAAALQAAVMGVEFSRYKTTPSPSVVSLLASPAQLRLHQLLTDATEAAVETTLERGEPTGLRQAVIPLLLLEVRCEIESAVTAGFPPV